jgi:hypothetical protein
MKANDFKVLDDCIEKGIDYGFMRFYKYHDFEISNEQELSLKQQIQEGVLNQICEYFNFDNNDGQE